MNDPKPYKICVITFYESMNGASTHQVVIEFASKEEAETAYELL